LISTWSFFSLDTNQDSFFLQPLVDGIDFLPARPGVYLIQNRRNQKWYVGQAKNIYRRCIKHRNELQKGLSANGLLRRDAVVHGADVFFFMAPRIDAIARSERASELNKIEVWFAVQLCAHDERFGYNLEVGHHRTMGARFRDRERKLMRRDSEKYQMLRGVEMYDPINSELLASWLPGN